MREQQILTFVLAMAPTMLTVLVGILINNARLSDLRSHLDHRFDEVDRRFEEVKDLWLDARLKHLEER
jgi:hypothetical protein